MCTRRSSSVEQDTKELKSREKLGAFKTLQCNIILIFDINSSHRMFSSMHDFISKTLTLNLCHCYLKCGRLKSLLALH